MWRHNVNTLRESMRLIVSLTINKNMFGCVGLNVLKQEIKKDKL